MGHSIGGGVALMAAIKDARIKYVIGLDAVLEYLNSTDLKKSISTNVLFINSAF